MARSPFAGAAGAAALAMGACLLHATALVPAELTSVAKQQIDDGFQRIRANLQWRRAEKRFLGHVALVSPQGRPEDNHLERTRVCPPHSHDSMHKDCVCDTGFSCFGSRCENGKGTRFKPFGKFACEDCRCDPHRCERHRDVCSDSCQQFARHLGTHNPRLLADHRDTVGLPTLLCVVCTSKDRSGLSHAVNKTWGQNCDDVLFISNTADAGLGNVFVAASQVPGGSAGAAGATGVTMRAWSHIRGAYGSKHRWFIVLQDDMYLAVDSLKRYLASLEATAQHIVPTYIGRRLRLRSGLVVNSGRAGYVLNAQALDVVLDVASKTRADNPGAALTYSPLVCASGHDADDLNCTHWRYLHSQTLPKSYACADTAPPSVMASSVTVATCLSMAGVLPTDSRDGHQLERFHLIGPDQLYEHPAWTEMATGKLKHMTAPFQFHGGVGSVSRDTITFGHSNQEMASAFQAFAKADCHYSSWFYRFSDSFQKTRLIFRNSRHFKRKFPT